MKNLIFNIVEFKITIQPLLVKEKINFDFKIKKGMILISLPLLFIEKYNL